MLVLIEAKNHSSANTQDADKILAPEVSFTRTFDPITKELLLDVLMLDAEEHFPFPSELSRHRLTHTKEKPYKCTHDGCTKAFNQKFGLDQHLRFHNGEKPFSCNYCSLKFSKSSNLNNHIRNTHSETERGLSCTNPTSPLPASTENLQLLRDAAARVDDSEETESDSEKEDSRPKKRHKVSQS